MNHRKNLACPLLKVKLGCVGFLAPISGFMKKGLPGASLSIYLDYIHNDFLASFSAGRINRSFACHPMITRKAALMARHLLMKPHALKPGDTLGIVAPASPFDGDAFERGTDLLHRMGFVTKTAAGVFARNGYLAGTDAQRVAQLHAMLADDQVQGIMCARGGFGALKILADLDYGLFRENVKPFIGFSDMTALHLVLQQQAGWVTFHGPMVTTLARCDDATQQAFYDTLTGQSQDRFDLSQARCLQTGEAQGALMGGNLSTLCHLVGTPFAGCFKNAILLLEDTGEAPYRIDRMLTQMKLAGAFDGLVGLVLGTFDHCGSSEEIEALMLSHFGPMAIPIVAAAAVGHGDRNLTLPLGILARLDAAASELIFLEKALDR
jgi:muramoyltetrapeptide carboxypeptidase